MTAVQCAVLSVLIGAALRTVFRAYMRSDGDHIALLQLNQVGSVCLFLLFIDLPEAVSISSEALVLFLFSGCMWTLCAYFDLRSYRHLDVAVAVILTSVRYLILTCAGFLLFEESFTPQGAFGICAIVLSIYLIVEFSSVDFRKGAALKLVSILGSTLAMISDKRLTQLMPVELVAIVAFLIPATFFSIGWPRKLLKIPGEIRASKGLLLLSPVALAASVYFFVRAFGQGELSITVAIGRTATVATFVFGVIFLGERKKLGRRAFASVICVIGAILVATK